MENTSEINPISKLGAAMGHCMGVWYEQEHGVTEQAPYWEASRILKALHDEFCRAKYAPKVARVQVQRGEIVEWSKDSAVLWEVLAVDGDRASIRVRNGVEWQWAQLADLSVWEGL